MKIRYTELDLCSCVAVANHTMKNQLDVGWRTDYLDMPWDAILNIYDMKLKCEVVC